MNVITVSQVNTYLKAIISESAPLQNIYIVGEISNFIHYYKSGHMYFTLKDEKSQIKAVMFSSYAERLRFTPENGMSVICRGRVALYEKESVCQLYVEDMQPEGAGALSVAFEQLKEKLSKEGLFDEIYKKPLPRYPKKIGVATSDMGAAVEDIKKITRRRYPVCELVIAPTIVQGDQAPDDIVRSLALLDSIEDVDLIIVGRGGGSMEDLWAFNTEKVARAVFACKKPVISAVGHETDFTICDFVADVRASTPSAGAELAVPDMWEIIKNLNNVKLDLSVKLKRRLEFEYQRLDEIQKGFVPAFEMSVNEKTDRLINAKNQILSLYQFNLNERKAGFSNAVEKLNTLSPLATLARGYSVVKKDGGVIKKAESLKVNDEIDIIFSDGEVKCRVTE